MAQDHNDIYTIVERLRMLEEGLDKNQKSVNQLGATFKPKTVSVLTSPKDPKNPMAGKMVGGCEESKETEVAEDILDKVKNSLVDYLKSIEDKYTDSNLKDKKHDDTDIKQKDKRDHDLISKENREIDPPEFDDEVEEDSELGAAMSGEIPAEQPAGEPGVSIKEDGPVNTITNECGLWEMHGDEHTGFEIRRAGRCLPTRFKNLDEAEMAIEMFAQRQRKHNEAQDYIDEA